MGLVPQVEEGLDADEELGGGVEPIVLVVVDEELVADLQEQCS